MTKDYIRISELIARDKLGILTPEENAELDKWLDKGELHRRIYSEIPTGEDLLLPDDAVGIEARQRAWGQIEKVINRRKTRIYYWWSAACMALVIGVAAVLLVGRHHSGPELQVAESFNRIAPGGQKAILQLSDGKMITLNDTSVLSIKGGSISKTGEGLIYKADSVEVKERLNILTVPRGGEYKLILADGTKIWLNSDSRLVYPEVFTGNERRVELHGEAYFEVAKNTARPFIVKTPESDIRVLGTEFNVKAYDKEERMITTLAAGSIMLTTSLHSVVLKPDQQAIVTPGQSPIVVKDIDAADYSAWRNGKFVFRREHLDVIMEDVARWYNVEVFYQNPEVREIVFSGKMDRYEQVGELLEMLQKTGKVTFGLKDKAIIVSSK